MYNTMTIRQILTSVASDVERLLTPASVELYGSRPEKISQAHAAHLARAERLAEVAALMWMADQLDGMPDDPSEPISEQGEAEVQRVAQEAATRAHLFLDEDLNTFGEHVPVTRASAYHVIDLLDSAKS